MAEIISFEDQAPDFESLVDEIDLLVPKYLETLDLLENEGSPSLIQIRLANVDQMWGRLTFLLSEVSKWETHIPLKEITVQCLQSELKVLEGIYLPLHEKKNLTPDAWDEACMNCSKQILHRMDAVLSQMGFDSGHQDRRWVKEALNSLAAAK